MYDLVNLDIEYVGDSSAENWNGTGKCSTHHGESDCYADVYNLCGSVAVGGDKAWKFTECMFELQVCSCLYM